MSAVEEPVPRRALVVAPRADSLEVDAVDPVRELALVWRSGGVEERQNCRLILCYRTRPICDGEPARKKTTNRVHGSLMARPKQRCSPLETITYPVDISVKHEPDDLDVSAHGSNSQRPMAVPGHPFDACAVVQ